MVTIILFVGLILTLATNYTTSEILHVPLNESLAKVPSELDDHDHYELKLKVYYPLKPELEQDHPRLHSNQSIPGAIEILEHTEPHNELPVTDPLHHTRSVAINSIRDRGNSVPKNVPLKIGNKTDVIPKQVANATKMQSEVAKFRLAAQERLYLSKKQFANILPNGSLDAPSIETPTIKLPISDAIKVAKHNDEIRLLSKYMLLEKKLVKVRLCTSILSPCRCSNSTCCGVLAGSVMTDCSYQVTEAVENIPPAVAVPVQVNPCSHVYCISGGCIIVSLISESGVVLGNRAECCQGNKFSQVNCAVGVNCQQRNKNGTYTACCSPGCSSFS